PAGAGEVLKAVACDGGEISPHVDLAAVRRDGADSTVDTCDGRRGAAIKAAEVGSETTGGVISPYIEQAIVDPEGEDIIVKPLYAIGERAPGRAVPAAEAVTVGEAGAGAGNTPAVELAVVDREGANITRIEPRRASSDGAPVGAVPAAEFGTGGQAAGAGEISPHVEIAVVDR